MRPPADFGSFKRVHAVHRRFAFDHSVWRLHVDLLLSFHFNVVGGISAAISFLWRNAPKLARQLVQAIAECGKWLLIVMLSSGEVKGFLRLISELLGDEWSVALLWVDIRRAPWFDNPIARCTELAHKRRRKKQARWLRELKQFFHDQRPPTPID
jgi:hypothetical protein